MRLIDAHKLEKEFKRIYNVTQNCQTLDWGTVKNAIRDQPEVDPVKHGHWVIADLDGYDIECSNCHNEGPYGMDAEDVLEIPYCPWCGAKMDEVTEWH